MSYIKLIKDKNNTQILPVTHEKAVKDNNGVTLDAKLQNIYTKGEVYTKSEVNGLVDSPHQNYVTVEDYASLPATGSDDTIYRVSNYDGENELVDVTVYSEYAWNGTEYIFLCVKSQIGEVFDISVYNNNATYADLADALGTNGANVPQDLRKGGMSVKFVQSSDNKYVQYRLMSNTFNTTVANWQGVGDNKIDGNAFYVTDSDGYIIVKIDSDGVHSVDFRYGNNETSVSAAIQSADSAVSEEVSLREEGDAATAALVSAEETRAKAEEEKKLDVVINDNTFYFTDANRNIIAKIDSDGVHSTDFKIGSENISILSAVNALIESLPHSDILYGKTLCCCGDSITYGADMDAAGIVQDSSIDVYQSNASGVFTKVNSDFRKSYGYQIAERHNMTFYNAGVSGSTIQGLSEKNGFSLANGRYTKLPDNLDIITIFFGWNDNAYGTLGTISDNTNETYYGAYNVVLPYLINKYPYAKIILIVPYGCTQGHRDAVRLLGNKWGVAVFDMYQGGTPLYYGKESYVGVNSTVVSANIAKFQVNGGAHPNYRGHQAIGDMLEQFLLSGFAYYHQQ